MKEFIYNTLKVLALVAVICGGIWLTSDHSPEGLRKQKESRERLHRAVERWWDKKFKEDSK